MVPMRWCGPFSKVALQVIFCDCCLGARNRGFCSYHWWFTQKILSHLLPGRQNQISHGYSRCSFCSDWVVYPFWLPCAMLYPMLNTLNIPLWILPSTKPCAQGRGSSSLPGMNCNLSKPIKATSFPLPVTGLAINSQPILPNDVGE